MRGRVRTAVAAVGCAVVGACGVAARTTAQQATVAPEASAARASTSSQARPVIDPGAVWRDTAGNVIQAHGGGVVREGRYWYWFGEDRAQDIPKAQRAVHVYRSTDLMTWEDRGRALTIEEPAEYVAQYGTNWQLERPKVFVAADPHARHRYVLYVHLDAAYKAAEVGVAVADRMEGPYTLVKHFRPLGEESRDIGQFVEDDGTNYLIFESRPTKGFFIAKLSADALDVVEKTAFVAAPLEGGAVVHTAGRYYCIGSHMTGWKPNPDVYATASSIRGPWSAFQNLAPPEANTYDGQSAELLKVKGTGGRPDAVIFIGDVWKPEALWDSRYLWLPLELRDGGMALPRPEPWRIDVTTGTVAFIR